MAMEETIKWLESLKAEIGKSEHRALWHYAEAIDMAIEALQADRPTGSWISRIDNDIWMLECSVCGCRVQEERYRLAVGAKAARCPYCGADLRLGGLLNDEDANSNGGDNNCK